MNMPEELNERATELMMQWLKAFKAGDFEAARRYYRDSGTLLKIAADAKRCEDTEDMFK